MVLTTAQIRRSAVEKFLQIHKSGKPRKPVTKNSTASTANLFWTSAESLKRGRTEVALAAGGSRRLKIGGSLGGGIIRLIKWCYQGQACIHLAVESIFIGYMLATAIVRRASYFLLCCLSLVDEV